MPRFIIFKIFILLQSISLYSQSNNEMITKWRDAIKIYNAIIVEKDSLLSSAISIDSITLNTITDKYKNKLDSANNVMYYYYAKVDSINNIFDKIKKEGDYNASKKNYRAALQKYYEVLNCKPEKADWVGKWVRIHDLYEYIASCYANLNELDSALYCLEKAIDAGLNSFTIFVSFDYYKLFKNPEWERLSKKMDNNFIKNNPNINFEIAFTLRYLFKQDQYIRKFYEHFNLTEKEKDSLSIVWRKIDSTNQAILIPIVDKYGYPGKDLVGEENDFIAYFIFLHSDLNIQKKYLPLISEYFSNSPNEETLRFLIDKILIAEGKKQLYGTQYMIGENNSCVLAAPMEDIENINKVRKELGLKEEQYDFNFIGN